MDINEANSKLIKIGNVVIVEYGWEYYVTPRTVRELLPMQRSIQDYNSFEKVEEAYNYAVKLPRNWNME